MPQGLKGGGGANKQKQTKKKKHAPQELTPGTYRTKYEERKRIKTLGITEPVWGGGRMGEDTHHNAVWAYASWGKDRDN